MKHSQTVNEYADRWERDRHNNFAAACYDQNSIAELQDSLAGEPDIIDCQEWKITCNEWIDAIQSAIAEKQDDR